MTWHPDILSKRQLRVLGQLGPVLAHMGFYLAGGTAVALDLGHRRSVDFDWFTSEGIADPLYLAQELREAGIAVVTHKTAPGTLHGSIQRVRVSLIGHRYPLLAALRQGPFGSRIAARADLIAMKLGAVAQRGAKKDFVDVYALGTQAYSLRTMVAHYQKKYCMEDVSHLLASLAYFDDADRERMPRLFWKVNWRAIKQTMQSWLLELGA